MKLTQVETILHPFFASPSKYEASTDYGDDHDKLSDSLKDLMLTGEKIKDIAMKYEFDIFEGELLASVVRDIIMGYVFLGDMTAEIQKRLGVDEQTAGAIGDRLLSDIFAEHWDELQVWNVEQYRKRVGGNEQGVISSEYLVMSEDNNKSVLSSQPSLLITPNSKLITNYSKLNTPKIATATSFRTNPTHAIISAGYNPRVSRLMPFQTSASRQAEILGNRDLQKQTDVRQPAKNNKVIDLRRK